MDDARHLLATYADLFQQNNNDHHCFTTTRVQFQQQYNQVVARSLMEGHVPPIEVWESFRYRNQLILAGLHNRRVHGICHNPIIATCIVTRYYPLHNYQLGEVDLEVLRVGGEGGRIAEAHQQYNQQLLNDQNLSEGNVCMMENIIVGAALRVVAYGRIDQGPNNVGEGRMGYTYLGLYHVVDHTELLTHEGFRFYRFELNRIHEN